MKRILILAISFLMILNFSVMASAQEDGVYENAGQLYEAWMRQGGVPDYITGVWSTDGGNVNLTFGVVKGEAGEKGQQEILALVRDDSSVTIAYQTYSRNYLYQIQKEIEDVYFEAGLGLVTAGVMEKENRIRFEVHTDFADNADTQVMIQKVTDQYGDAVYFRYIDTYPQFVGGTEPAPTGPMLVMPNPQNQMFPFVFVLCGIVLAFFLFIEMQRHRVIAVAADGSAIALEKSQISQKEIEETIRKTEIQIPESLDHRVMQSVNQ